MKKIISVILLASFILSLAACAGGEKPDETQPSGTTVSDTTVADTTAAPETDEPNNKPDPEVTAAEKMFLFNRDGEKRVFVDSKGVEIPYRIYVPADYSEDYAYPLVLFLHGAGERGYDNEAQLKLTVMEPFMDKECPIYQSIVIVPQCPEYGGWVDTNWDLGSYSTDKVTISKAMNAVVELLDATMEEFSINADRQYVFGISMGGYGTWDLLARFPDRFAAAVPICGGGDPSKAAELVDIPIYVFHDINDRSVPVSASQDMVNAIKAAGGEKIIYTETEGVGHEVWTVAINASDLSVIDWMFEQRRS